MTDLDFIVSLGKFFFTATCSVHPQENIKILKEEKYTFAQNKRGALCHLKNNRLVDRLNILPKPQTFSDFNKIF